MDAKKVYEAPKLTVHGDIEKITMGQGIGLRDLFVYGLSDPIGNCRNNSCETGS